MVHVHSWGPRTIIISALPWLPDLADSLADRRETFPLGHFFETLNGGSKLNILYLNVFRLKKNFRLKTPANLNNQNVVKAETFINPEKSPL